MSLFNRNRSSEEQQNYESFMDGFRDGFPVDGDKETEVDANDPEYQRGLAIGQAEYQANQAYLKQHGLL